MQRILKNIDWIASLLLFLGVVFYIHGYGGTELDSLQNFNLRAVPGGTQTDLFQEAEGMAIVHFVGTDCNPCRRDAQELLRFHRRHSDIAVIGIGSGDGAELEKWRAELGLSYPLFIADPVDIGDKAGVGTFPSTILLGKGRTKLTHIRGALSYNQLLAYTGRDR
jgi:hypothetical protein